MSAKSATDTPVQGRIVIVGYKPKPGCEAELRRLADSHWQRLDQQGLVSERRPVIMQAADGTVVEVFEWLSREAIEQAHGNAEVLQMWQEFSAVCEIIPAGQVGEIMQLFSEFTPLN